MVKSAGKSNGGTAKGSCRAPVHLGAEAFQEARITMQKCTKMIKHARFEVQNSEMISKEDAEGGNDLALASEKHQGFSMFQLLILLH